MCLTCVYICVLMCVCLCVYQEDTISINHNWLNGCNVAVAWRFLQGELDLVQKEIQDWKENMDSWHQHCQVRNSVKL